MAAMRERLRKVCDAPLLHARAGEVEVLQICTPRQACAEVPGAHVAHGIEPEVEVFGVNESLSRHQVVVCRIFEVVARQIEFLEFGQAVLKKRLLGEAQGARVQVQGGDLGVEYSLDGRPGLVFFLGLILAVSAQNTAWPGIVIPVIWSFMHFR
tara:strand:+ start:656 stop:1117 length:462 start_codon:yes stop_codon:yes gene_type:complete